MSNTVNVTYTRKVTNKFPDGSFEAVELGGGTQIEIESIESPDEAAQAWEVLYEEFSQKVESSLATALKGMLPKQVEATTVVNNAPVATAASTNKWIKDTVAKETENIRSRVLPGETIAPKSKFTSPVEDDGSPELDVIVEGEAVAFDGVRVFYQNSSTKIGRAVNGSKYGMLRIGKKGEIPGGFVTAKSFEPEMVDLIAEVLDAQPEFINVYGYFEKRKNVEGLVYDLQLQGIEPSI